MNADQVVQRHFLEVRAKILEIAATLDRIDRSNSGDPLDEATEAQRSLLIEAVGLLLAEKANRAEQVQHLFSRDYDPDWRSGNGGLAVDYIDPHIHMVSRITDDYETLARMGCVAMSEPAFWAGFDRGSVDGFRDYFRQLTEVEPKRAAQFGIQHFTWLCINAKEAEDVALSRDVIQMIPEFINAPNVLGIGEIGLNKNTRNEATIFLEHLEVAVEHDTPILIHTPHLEDKFQGTRMILDMLLGDKRIQPDKVLVDHVEEHTIKAVLDHGFWAGMTLYPVSKCTPQRAADMIEQFGPDRLLANSAGDWGISKPTAVPDLIFEMRQRGHSESLIRKIVYDNPVEFFSKSKNFRFQPRS